jgi:hypothetical protein
VIGHYYVATYANTILACTKAIVAKSCMGLFVRQRRLPVKRAKRNEIQWLVDVYQIQARRFSFDHQILPPRTAASTVITFIDNPPDK